MSFNDDNSRDKGYFAGVRDQKMSQSRLQSLYGQNDYKNLEQIPENSQDITDSYMIAHPNSRIMNDIEG